MEIKEYQEKSKRTLNNDLSHEQLLSNMIFGIVGETGEVVDLLKKHLYQGHELDWFNIREEIGDVMFYIVNLCSLLGTNLDQVLQENYDKLLKRYPEGFEVERSINRER